MNHAITIEWPPIFICDIRWTRSKYLLHILVINTKTFGQLNYFNLSYDKIFISLKNMYLTSLTNNINSWNGFFTAGCHINRIHCDSFYLNYYLGASFTINGIMYVNSFNIFSHTATEKHHSLNSIKI